MTSGNDRTGRTELSNGTRTILIGGAAALVAGLIAWLWIGNWRLGVTGLAVLLFALTAAALIHAGDRKT